MSVIKLIRRSQKLLFPLSKGRRCCCECCLYDGDCIHRNETPDGVCDDPTFPDPFRGTITVSWCGLSITFSMDERPSSPSSAISVGPIETGFEKPCGTTIFDGQEYEVTYKYEQAWIYILGGGYDGSLWVPGEVPYASSRCVRILFPIITRLQGVLVINRDGGELDLGYAGNDQEQFVFVQDHCRRELLIPLPFVTPDCGDSPGHKHCRVDPIVSVMELT